MSGSFESSASHGEDLFKEEGISFRIVGDISALKEAHENVVEGYKQKNPDMESRHDRVRQIARKVLDCSDYPDKLKTSVTFYYSSVLMSTDMVEVKQLGDILDEILQSEMRLDVAALDPTSTTNICTSTDGGKVLTDATNISTTNTTNISTNTDGGKVLTDATNISTTNVSNSTDDGKVLTDATNTSTTNVSTSCSNRSSSSTTCIVEKKTTRWLKTTHTEPLVLLMRKGLIDPDLATKCGCKTKSKPNENLRQALVEILNGDVLANSEFELSVSENSFINGYMRESSKFRQGKFDNLEIVENENKTGRFTRSRKTLREKKKAAGNMSSNDASTKDTTSTNAESDMNENNDPTSVSVVSPEVQVKPPSPEVQTKSDDTAKKPSAKDADPMVTPSPEVQTKRMVSFNKSVKTTYLEPIPDEEGDDDGYDSFDVEAEMLELDNEVLETKATKNLEIQKAYLNSANEYLNSANEGKEFNSHLEGMRANTKMLGQLATKSPAPKKKEMINKFRSAVKKVKGVVAVAESRSKAVDVSQSDAASNDYETPTSNVYETPLQKKKLFGGEQD